MSLGSTTHARGFVADSPLSRLATLPEWPESGEPRTLGWEAIRWAESGLLVQPNGPTSGKPFRLTKGQLTFLLWWYAVDDDGRWMFQHGVRRLAKGSGKSPFAAVLALIEFLAPVRLDRFDHRAPGGCVGRPVDMPLVQIAATSEQQTANTMRMVRAFAPKKSDLVDEYGIDWGRTRFNKLPEGTLEVITSSPTGAEGAESTFVVADETEHWKRSNGGLELAATLEDNLAKSGQRMLETSNAWVPGAETVAEASWDAWVAQEEESQVSDAGRILYDARIAPPETDMGDYESLQSALRFVYADCTWKRGADGEIDVRPMMGRIRSLKSKPDDALRKYLNRPTVSLYAWASPAEWEQLADTSRVVDPDEPVVMFFDGSKSNDATALIGCCVNDGHVFTLGVWEPLLLGFDVPVAEVDATVARAFDQLNVVGFFGDVREWESFVLLDWPRKYADRLKVMAVPGGKKPEPVAWDMRGRTFDFTKACELVLAEIQERRFTHDNDPRLARHVTNMDRSANRYGVSVCKRSPELKIDAGVCMIGARMVRDLVIAAGVSESRSGVVWAG